MSDYGGPLYRQSLMQEADAKLHEASQVGTTDPDYSKWLREDAHRLKTECIDWLRKEAEGLQKKS